MSVEVGGPHPSSEGREDMMSEREIGAMITAFVVWWMLRLSGFFEGFAIVESLVGLVF